MANLSCGVRWVSLLGISSSFPKKWREVTPAVPIVLVGAFVTAIVQLIGNPGLFLQLAQGFMSIFKSYNCFKLVTYRRCMVVLCSSIVYFPLLIF